MSVVIRKMRTEDIPDVKRVDIVSFGAMLEARYSDMRAVTPRTDENILSYMRSDPDGAMVAVDDFAGIIGSSFSHIWGRTGWVGPVSVLPNYQGRGVGKELVKRSLDYLDERGCTDIGLETMPESQVNLGMYLRIGLRPTGLVFIMGKELTEASVGDESSEGDVLIERYSESRVKQDLLSKMRRLSQELLPGLDYGPAIVSTHEYVAGDTLVATKGNRLVGFSVVHTQPRRVGMQNAAVKALVISPSAGDSPLESLIAASELMALDDRSSELSVPVPSVCSRPLDALLSRGYQVAQTYERMIWLGSPGTSERAYNLSSWSG